MTALYANNVSGTLAAAIGPTDTALLLGAGQGAAFPAFAAGDYCYATLIDPTTFVIEIVKITARATDALTVVRGRDGTPARTYPIGTVIELRLCAVMMVEVDYRRVAGLASGLATLDATTKIPDAQIPAAIARAADVIPLTQRATANGVATLDASSLIPDAQIPATIARTANVVPLTQRAAANGVATLDATTKIPAAQIPDLSATYLPLAAAGKTVSGALTFSGTLSTQAINGTTLTGSTAMVSPSFKSSTATVELATTGAGTVYLRPNGAGSATNQGALASTGILTVVDLTTTSDRRRKKLIRAAAPDARLADALRLRTFAWRSDGRPGRGVIAQDVAQIAPAYVHAGSDGYLSIDKAGLALEAVLGLAARVRHLEGSKTCSSPRNSSKRISHCSVASSSPATKSRRSSR